MRLPFRRKSKLPSVLPAHLAVIMDGNGRWASRRGLPRSGRIVVVEGVRLAHGDQIDRRRIVAAHGPAFETLSRRRARKQQGHNQ